LLGLYGLARGIALFPASLLAYEGGTGKLDLSCSLLHQEAPQVVSSCLLALYGGAVIAHTTFPM